MKVRKQAHAVYRCEYHIVWIPRYRYKVLVDGVDAYLAVRLDEARKWHPEIEFVSRVIRPDHVHLVLSFPPRYAIAEVVCILKTNTSAALKSKFPFLRERYWGRGGIWSEGYFVCTVGLDERAILAYVPRQATEDTGQAQLELL